MMTSVTAVEVAPDLKTCKAYISVLGDDKEKERHHCRAAQRRGIYSKAAGKKTESQEYAGDSVPRLDESIEYGIHMSKVIREVNQEISESEGEDE